MDKKYSTNSIISAVLAGLSLILILALLEISFANKGVSGSWIGALGVTGAAMAFMGLRYGMAGFQDECKSYLLCKIGAILSTVVIAGWFFIVCMGIAMNI